MLRTLLMLLQVRELMDDAFVVGVPVNCKEPNSKNQGQRRVALLRIDRPAFCYLVASLL